MYGTIRVGAALFALSSFVVTAASAATLQVGAGKTYSTISAASAQANDGDVIEIHPGTYRQGAAFYDDNLTIRAAPGAAPGSVVVRGGTVQGKALFVTKGDNITIDGIRFQDAAVPDRNGAGIRGEGRNLTVLNSQFYNVENGILTGGEGDDNIVTIRGSSFDLIRSPGGAGVLTHAVYIGKTIGGVVIEDSTFSRVTTGHYVKSRAKSTIVRRSTIDDREGTASYLIDAAEGGQLVVEGNTLIKGANAGNPTAIAMGFEQYKGGNFVNPPGFIFVGDNDFTNYHNGNVTFFNNRTGEPAELHNNELTVVAGRVSLAKGEHIVTTDADHPLPIDSLPIGNPPVGDLPYRPIADLPPLNMPGQVDDVPAPGAALLLGLAALGLGAARRRRA
ncbi:MAG: hypothetical protein WA979_13610 [Pacificimonas sp.]